MNKKILYSIIIIQFIGILLLYNHNKYIPNKAIKMIESLSLQTKNDINSVDYDILHELNSQRLKNIENSLKKLTDQNGLNTYTEEVSLTHSEKELIRYLLKNYKPLNRQEKKLVIAFIEYISLKSIENSTFKSYFQFENIYIQPSAINSTINLGESYEVFLPICGKNESVTTELILDGDTVKTEGYFNYYSERPTTAGKIKRSGYMVVSHMEKELKIPVEFEYTVVDKE